jgi:hypothetical protein
MATQVQLKNFSQLNAIRVSYQDIDTSHVDKASGKPIPNRWKPSARPTVIIKAGEAETIFVGAGVTRTIIEELPT